MQLDGVIPSATAVLIKQAGVDNKGGEIEVFLARRNDALSFLPGYWVFPGGAVDPEDYYAKSDQNASGDKSGEKLREKLSESEAYLNAVDREVFEEVGVCIADRPKLDFAHWITPEGSPKRYSTKFYLTGVDSDLANSMQVDGSELVEGSWLSISDAIKMHKSGQAPMLPPTIVALLRLQGKSCVDTAVALFANKAVGTIEPKACFDNDQLVMLYNGDAGFDVGDPNVQGKKHRCLLVDNVWEYINEIESELLS